MVEKREVSGAGDQLRGQRGLNRDWKEGRGKKQEGGRGRCRGFRVRNGKRVNLSHTREQVVKRGDTGTWNAFEIPGFLTEVLERGEMLTFPVLPIKRDHISTP